MDWLGDVRFGFRALAKNPGFSAMAVAMLALGIGINAAVFTVTNATLFKGFPLVAKNDRMLYLATGINCCVSYPDFKDWKAQAKSFDDMAIVRAPRIASGARRRRHDPGQAAIDGELAVVFRRMADKRHRELRDL